MLFDSKSTGNTFTALAAREEIFAELPDYTRKDGVALDELKLFYPFLPKADGIMLDVGAHLGGSCIRFLQRGWTVHAFEPDPVVREHLHKKTAQFEKIHINAEAVSRVSGQQYPWFTSPDSTGANSMVGFTEKHVQTGTVKTLTLNDYIAKHDITHIDLLKIDTEGFDFMVLQGFPFDKIKPGHILCEYEDAKSVPLGCTTHELAQILIQNGYTVFVSEWHPIIRYGIKHQWRTFYPYPAPLKNPRSWGNLLAFLSPPDPRLLLETLKQFLQIGVSMPPGNELAHE